MVVIYVSILKNQKYQTANQKTPTEFKTYVWEVILNPYASQAEGKVCTRHTAILWQTIKKLSAI